MPRRPSFPFSSRSTAYVRIPKEPDLLAEASLETPSNEPRRGSLLHDRLLCIAVSACCLRHGMPSAVGLDIPPIPSSSPGTHSERTLNCFLLHGLAFSSLLLSAPHSLVPYRHCLSPILQYDHEKVMPLVVGLENGDAALALLVVVFILIVALVRPKQCPSPHPPTLSGASPRAPRANSSARDSLHPLLNVLPTPGAGVSQRWVAVSVFGFVGVGPPQHSPK
ncbi:uncharacterized protein EV422DRAFT_92569 [Fimicolochytrium jonesii]|uniref:uncharacterized protein n=1 Tax=Fimicolochytrium jonesii TaxID=1396493 RepID=UPI0022FDD6AA|nr:uncharacterized protein EV422DRAFT_92569 [Fimicolochytrium jonesii]KAI8819943.1 hypothetical protein EV422DRAFT_92569 [Fimicolochytrium jonesii]